MKKIAMSLLTIAMVATLSIGATGAYFSDTNTVSGMTFASGTLEVTDTSPDWSKTVSFSNLKPGDHIRKWVTLKNSGSLDVASLTVKGVNVHNEGGLLGQVKLSLIGQVTGFDNAYYTPDWTGGATVDSFLTGNATDLLGTYFYSGGTPAHVLAPGSSDTIILDFEVPASLSNDWQGKTASFDLQFSAEQSHTGVNYF